MNKVSQIKVGAVLSYISLFAGIAITLVYTPYQLRVLGDGEYGIFNLVNSTIAYLTILSFGFEGAIVKYTVKFRTLKDKASERSLHGMFFIVYSIIGLVALTLGFILASQTPLLFGNNFTPDELELTELLLYLASINVAITFPFSIFASIVTAYERFIFSKMLLMIRNVLNPALMVLVLTMGAGSIGMILVATFINLFVGFWNVIFCKRVLKIRMKFSNFNKKLFREIITFSFFVFVSTIVDRLYWSTGNVLLGMFSGASAIALLNIAIQFNNYYQQLSACISNLFMPRIAAICAREHTNTELSEYMLRVGRIQFFILALALTGFALLGKMFITMWVGPGKEEIYYIALTLFVPITIPLIQNVGIYILQAKNKHAFRSLCYLGISILNVFISIPLIQKYGAMGPAIAIAISYTLGQIIIMNIYYSRAIGLSMSRFWLGIISMLPAVIIPASIQVLIMQFMPLNGAMGFFIYAIIYVPLYLISMFTIGLNKDEKKMFLGPLKRILKI